jgi:aminoglycoside 3-N-acetyltransferase
VRIFLRKMFAGLTDSNQRRRLKRFEYKIRKWFAHMGPPMTRNDLRAVLVSDLGLEKGDTVMVHAGLSVLNTRLDPVEIRDLICEIIGANGHLVVPAFSPVAAIDYMKDPTPFDRAQSRSGMGAFAETIRLSDGAVRSFHPTKSVVAIGPEAKSLCADHEECIFPFGPGSPFEKLLERNVLIIGIGVPMSYLSFVHVAEDMHPDRVRKRVWDPRALKKRCIDGAREVVVATRVHDMKTMAHADPAKFCRRHLPPGSFKILRRSSTPFFSVRGRILHEEIVRGFDENFSIYD